jgi:hypothetical protein
MRRLGAALLVLATGCSLPLPSGVHTPSGVKDQGQSAELQVLPPGPTAGQSQTATVIGFLAAQASPAGDYAIARQFLTGDAVRSWSPATGVRVYLPDTEKVDLNQNDTSVSVQVRLTTIATVDRTGHYEVASERPNDFYGLTKSLAGWRISSVPAGVGLQLSQIDLQRTFVARNIYYLAPQLHPADPRHVVPDRVFVPAGPALDETLVRRMVAPASSGLLDSVDGLSAPALTVLSVGRSRDGVVTVTLSDDALGLGTTDLQDLFARTVWTLRQDVQFTGLRLRTTRGALRLPGQPEVQPATAWESYDPDGLAADPPYYYVAGHRLLGSISHLPLTAGGVRVDHAAVSPRGDRVAVLGQSTGGQVEVSLGSTRTFGVTRMAVARGLSSPTWGSGEEGLWMLEGGSQVVRLDPAGSTLQTVSMPGRPAGPITSLRLSRDGARAALIIAGTVYVSRVLWSTGAASLVDARPVASSGAPQQVVWSTPTELVVLEVGEQGARAVQRVAVDGSSPTPVSVGLLTPTAVAAAGTTLIVASGGALFAVAQAVPKRKAVGTNPVFPG